MDIKKSLIGFYHRHPIWSHLGLMLVVTVFLALLAMLFLNIWTMHGRTAKVPDVTGMNFEKAQNVLEDADLDIELYDSIYDDTLRLPNGRMLTNIPGGTVVKTLPGAGAVVKPGRAVYVTIKAYCPEQIRINIPLNVSRSQALDDFTALGFKDISFEYVPSEYDDLVTGVTANGVHVDPGLEIPRNAHIVIYVGRSEMLRGEIDNAIDSLDIQPVEPLGELPDPDNYTLPENPEQEMPEDEPDGQFD